MPDAAAVVAPPADAGVDGMFPEDAPAPPPRDARRIPPSLVWGPCDWGDSREEAECTNITVPLNWDAVDGRQIEIGLRRFPTRGATGMRIWLVQGGPGATAGSLDFLATMIQARHPDVEVAIMEHRGIGVSTRLGCPRSGEAPRSAAGTSILPNEWQDCVREVEETWGDDLVHFTSEAAARDLGYAVELTDNALPIYVYGISYGTWLLHHYLHHFSEQPEGVILDSICSVGTCRLPILFSENHDAVGRQLLAMCGADRECSRRLDGDPLAFAERALAAAEGGHCSESGLTAADLRQSLGVFIRIRDYWPVIPSVLYRFDRCSAADANALSRLRALTDEAPYETDDGSSPMLQALIVASELGDFPISWEALVGAEADNIFTASPGEEFIRALASMRTYEAPIEATTFPDIPTPLLLMNGSMDPQTPPWAAAPAAMHFTGEHQAYVEFPRTAHGAMVGSGVSPEDGCGWEIFDTFITDPTRGVDDRCVETAPAVSFADSRFLARAIYGDNSLYDIATPSRRPLEPLTGAEEAEIAALRRRLHRREMPF